MPRPLQGRGTRAAPVRTGSVAPTSSNHDRDRVAARAHVEAILRLGHGYCGAGWPSDRPQRRGRTGKGRHRAPHLYGDASTF
ncbi:MAG: hypothetical protein M3Y74_14395 [Chloroflexota bacterium]|nr:hypothetical protein [Chloroflexota bacterium]